MPDQTQTVEATVLRGALDHIERLARTFAHPETILAAVAEGRRDADRAAQSPAPPAPVPSGADALREAALGEYRDMVKTAVQALDFYARADHYADDDRLYDDDGCLDGGRHAREEIELLREWRKEAEEDLDAVPVVASSGAEGGERETLVSLRREIDAVAARTAEALERAGLERDEHGVWWRPEDTEHLGRGEPEEVGKTIVEAIDFLAGEARERLRELHEAEAREFMAGRPASAGAEGEREARRRSLVALLLATWDDATDDYDEPDGLVVPDEMTTTFQLPSGEYATSVTQAGRDFVQQVMDELAAAPASAVTPDPPRGGQLERIDALEVEVGWMVWHEGEWLPIYEVRLGAADTAAEDEVWVRVVARPSAGPGVWRGPLNERVLVSRDVPKSVQAPAPAVTDPEGEGVAALVAVRDAIEHWLRRDARGEGRRPRVVLESLLATVGSELAGLTAAPSVSKEGDA